MHWTVPRILQIHISKSAHHFPPALHQTHTLSSGHWLGRWPHQPASQPGRTPRGHLNYSLPCTFSLLCSNSSRTDSHLSIPAAALLRQATIIPHLACSVITAAARPPSPQCTHWAHAIHCPPVLIIQLTVQSKAPKFTSSAKLSLIQPPSYLAIISYLICLPNQ